MTGDVFEDIQFPDVTDKFAQQQDEERRDIVIQNLMHNRNGRAFAYMLLEQTGVFQSVFSDNNPVMCFNEGQRNVGLWLFTAIQRLCPELYVKMINEYYQENHHGNERDTSSGADI